MNNPDSDIPFDLSNVRCPICFNQNLEYSGCRLNCQKCGADYPVQNGLLDIRVDQSYDTKLDVESYDENHGLNDDSHKLLYNVYDKVLRKHTPYQGGECLEIASGTGHLTIGLANYSPFTEIHCSDISPEMMKRLRKKIEGGKRDKKFSYYLFDANIFPFVDKSFSAVVGNSVLHHFAHFENTLLDSYRVLKPGGVAIFGEPVLDTQVFASLAASLIRAIDKRQSPRLFTETEDRILSVIEQRYALKRENLRSDRTGLSEMEDKFIFPINYMRSEAEKIGYKKFECINFSQNFDFGNSIKSVIARVFKQIKADTQKLENYNYIFKSLTDTYGETMREDIASPFSIFLFVK